MAAGPSARLSVVPAALARGAGFLGLWLVLFGFAAVNLPAGVATAAVAPWASLRLLPTGRVRLRPAALAALALRFLWQSGVAGADVAWRA